MSQPTPSSHPGLATRPADFTTLADALDYAARGPTGLNFYSGKGALLEALPYRNLRQEALALARRMLGAGLRPGCRVGLIAQSDGDFARAFFACQYAALVPAPLPLPAAFGGRSGYVDHLRRMLESAHADALFGPPTIESWFHEAVAGLGREIVTTLDGVEPATGALPPQDPEGVAYLQFSSGSTRFPSGIAITQRAFMANTQCAGGHGLRLAEGDRCISWLPFYHDMGLVGFMLMPMTFQCSVDILPTHEFARRPLLWLDLISRNRGTITYSPSFGYELCTRRSEQASTDGLDLSSLRSAGIGGDLIRPNVLARFAERFAPRGFDADAFLPSYGMAEATLALAIGPLGRGARLDTVDAALLEKEHRAVEANGVNGRSRTFILCGGILPGHDIEVRDETGGRLPERRVGRVFVRGPSLMSGYFRAPAESARVLSREGWLDTGDLGYLLDGQIVITGREKDLIIVKGRNLWPQDIEWTLETEIAVLRSGDVAVFSGEDDRDEEVVALVQCRAHEPAARLALTTQAANIIRGRHGIDAKVVLVPPRALPQTTSGKLSRSRARALYLAGSFGHASGPVPGGADGE